MPKATGFSPSGRRVGGRLHLPGHLTTIRTALAFGSKDPAHKPCPLLWFPTPDAHLNKLPPPCGPGPPPLLMLLRCHRTQCPAVGVRARLVQGGRETSAQPLWGMPSVHNRCGALSTGVVAEGGLRLVAAVILCTTTSKQSPANCTLVQGRSLRRATALGFPSRHHARLVYTGQNGRLPCCS